MLGFGKQTPERVSSVEEKWLSDALAPVLVHRPRSQKRTDRATVLRKLSRRLVIFLGEKMTKNLEKARFAKVHAGARLSRAKKLNPLRPRARLGASTAITKKTARATVMRTKGVFMAIF